MAGLNADVKAYAPAIARIADLLALASVIPVILASRFGRQRRYSEYRPKPPALASKQQKDGETQQSSEKGDQGQAQQPETAEDQNSSLPLGIPSVLLMIASEIVACHDVFSNASPKSSATKKSKSKDGSLTGPLAVLLGGISKGQKAAKPSMGAVEKVSSIVVEALNPAEAFATAHGLVMLIALGVVTASLIGRYAQALPQHFSRGVRPLVRNVALISVALLFAGCHRELLGKVWRAFVSEHLLSTLQVPLRVAALLAASRPGPEAPRPPDGGETADVRTTGTPTMFAALQAASLAASLSAGIANGELARALAPFSQQSVLASAMDSSALLFFGLIFLGLIWVSLVHLQRKPGYLVLTAMLSIASSPLTLAVGWPKVGKVLGLKSAKDLEKGLIQLVSMTYAAGAGSLFVTGGTVTLIVVMFLGQILVQIHGLDELIAAVS